MSYCINRAVSISSDTFAPAHQTADHFEFVRHDDVLFRFSGALYQKRHDCDKVILRMSRIETKKGKLCAQPPAEFLYARMEQPTARAKMCEREFAFGNPHSAAIFTLGRLVLRSRCFTIMSRRVRM